MTTRRQILLLVMPLFAGLALLAGTLMAWLQIRAADRDFRTETETAAFAVSEFVSGENYAAELADPARVDHRLSTVFARILRWRQIERIFIVDAAGRILADTDQGGRIPDSLRDWTGAVGEVHLSPIIVEDDGHRVRAALVASPQEGVRVGVEVSAEPYLARREKIVRDVLVHTLWTLGAGLAATLALAAFVSSQFRRLSQVAGQVGDRAFETGDRDGRIQEVADVGSVLGVMHSVLMETFDKTRRSLSDREYVRSDHVLAQVFREGGAPPAAWTCAGLSGIFLQVGTPLAIQGFVPLDERTGAAFTGLLPSDSGLEAAVRARAAATFLSAALRNRPLGDAATEACALFGLRELAAVRWSGDRFEHWHRTGTNDPVMTAGDLLSGRPVVLACLDEADRGRLAIYLRTYPEAPLDRLAADLPAVLVAATAGAVLALQRDAGTV